MVIMTSSPGMFPSTMNRPRKPNSFSSRLTHSKLECICEFIRLYIASDLTYPFRKLYNPINSQYTLVSFTIKCANLEQIPKNWVYEACSEAVRLLIKVGEHYGPSGVRNSAPHFWLIFRPYLAEIPSFCG